MPWDSLMVQWAWFDTDLMLTLVFLFLFPNLTSVPGSRFSKKVKMPSTKPLGISVDLKESTGLMLVNRFPVYRIHSPT